MDITKRRDKLLCLEKLKQVPKLKLTQNSWSPTLTNLIGFSGTPTISNAIYENYGSRIVASFTITGTLQPTLGTSEFQFYCSVPVERTDGNFTNLRQASGCVITSPELVFNTTQECTSNEGEQTIDFVQLYNSLSSINVTIQCTFFYTLLNSTA